MTISGKTESTTTWEGEDVTVYHHRNHGKVQYWNIAVRHGVSTSTYCNRGLLVQMRDRYQAAIDLLDQAQREALEAQEANKFTMRHEAIEEYLEFTDQDHHEGREALALLLNVVDAHIPWMLARSDLENMEVNQ